MFVIVLEPLRAMCPPSAMSVCHEFLELSSSIREQSCSRSFCVKGFAVLWLVGIYLVIYVSCMGAEASICRMGLVTSISGSSGQRPKQADLACNWRLWKLLFTLLVGRGMENQHCWNAGTELHRTKYELGTHIMLTVSRKTSSQNLILVSKMHFRLFYL